MAPVRSMSTVHPWGLKYFKLEALIRSQLKSEALKKSFGLCMWLGEFPLWGQGNTQLPVEAEWEPVESNFGYHTAVESHSPGYTCPYWSHDSTADESQWWMQDVSIFCQSVAPFLMVHSILQGRECSHFMPFPSLVWKLTSRKIFLQWLNWIGLWYFIQIYKLLS